ncbi:MAG TPA: hypothetical protein VJO13_09045 [Ktedonobacterales bacterium]|nr:hypothetical protein [Ktedonobacterales bacterium]
MMEHLTECAICGVTLHYETTSQLCDAHLGIGALKLAVLIGDTRYTDFQWPHNHRYAMTVNPQIANRPLPPYIDLRMWLWEMDRRARLWLDGGDQGWAA